MNFDTDTDDYVGKNHTPAHEETVISIAYLDEDGCEQFNVVRTTRSAERMRETAPLMKAAWEQFYHNLGCIFLSAQISYERTTFLVGTRARPVLSLISGGVVIGDKA